MALASAFFYLFSGVLVAGAAMVIFARNPVHSVLWLILCFFNAAGLFLLLGAEFLAMILVVVYVGAVAVLFLFVVMMIDVDFKALRQGLLNYVPVGAVIGLILLAELVIVVTAWTMPIEATAVAQLPIPPLTTTSNAEALGQVLYTRYVLFFQLSGIILLVAMVGAIVLTLRQKVGVKRQNIAEQVGRTRAASIEVRKVETGKGV